MLNQVYVEKIEDYINQNYNKKITLVQVADYIGFSSFYLSRLMKESFDSNYSTYLTKIRIENAKVLLQSDEYSISEVSYEVGYAEPKYFSNVFRKNEGMSPSDYRRQYVSE